MPNHRAITKGIPSASADTKVISDKSAFQAKVASTVVVPVGRPNRAVQCSEVHPDDKSFLGPMSRGASLAYCRNNGSVEKAISGEITLPCFCSARDRPAGVVSSVICGDEYACVRNRSKLGREFGFLEWSYRLLDDRRGFVRVVLICTTSFAMGALVDSANALAPARQEICAIFGEAGIAVAVGSFTIVGDGRGGVVGTRTSTTYPKYSIMFQAAVPEEEFLRGELKLRQHFGEDIVVSKIDARSGGADSRHHEDIADAICHYPARLFALVPAQSGQGLVSWFPHLKMRPLLGMQKVEVSAALMRLPLFDPLFTLGARLHLIDGHYSLIGTDPSRANTG